LPWFDMWPIFSCACTCHSGTYRDRFTGF
jgi:hypothetical protein